MSAAKHTPGPWWVPAAANPAHIYCDRGGLTGGATLAVVRHDEGAEDEAEATARLMAAAPELLAALESVMQDTVVIGMSGGAFDLARAAIAKARGAT